MLKQVLGYGLLLGLGLIVVRGIEHAYLAKSLDLETYVALIAIAFLAAGVMVGTSQSRRKSAAASNRSLPGADSERLGHGTVELSSSYPQTLNDPPSNGDSQPGLTTNEPAIVSHVLPASERPRTNPHSAPAKQAPEAIRIPQSDPLQFSRREIEILDGLARGRSNQEIAEDLYLSLNTVKTHLKNIYRKLDVERRGQAVARAKELEILK